MGASQCSYYSSLVYESLNRLKRPHCFQSTYDLICWSDDATPGLTPVKDRRKAKQRKPNSSLIAWGCTCSCHGQMCLANIRMQSLLLPILYLKTASPLQIKAQDHLASTSGDWTKVVFSNTVLLRIWLCFHLETSQTIYILKVMSNPKTITFWHT